MGSSISASIVKQTLQFTGANGTTASFNSTGGATILVFVTAANGPLTGATVSDNKGNSYSLLAGPGATGGGPSVSVYGCLSATVGSGHTVTVTGSGGNMFAAVTVDVRSGIANLTIDINNYQTPAGTTANNTGTPANDGSIIYLVVSPNINTASLTPANGWGSFDISQLPGTGGVEYSQYVASQVQGAKSSAAVTTTASGSDAWSAYMFALAPTSYAPSGTLKGSTLMMMGVG